jgi:NAD(P)-dependent dehydrogenase (short-subunit alcohol dehydrogenase family)
MASDLVVLITGCSSGFGELIAKSCARAGHNVVATMRDTTGRNAEAAGALAAWADAEQLRLRVVEMDVASTASVNAGISEVQAGLGPVDVVVNNAGIAAGGPLEAFDIEQMQDLFDTNVFGPLRVDKAVLPAMRQRRSGLLIHVTSTLGRILPGKWAAEGLAESLHYQLRPFHIDVVILEPGSFPTPAVSRGMRPRDQAVVDAYAAAAPPPRPTPPAPDYTPPDPQEVADEVVRLIGLPAGTRPLRSVVGPVFTEGVAEYNALYEQYRDRLIESLRRPDQARTWTAPR